MDDATQLAVGGAGYAVLSASGKMLAWGHGYFDGITAANTALPRVVTIAPPAVHVSMGSDFYCALRPDKTVACWGDNQLNAIGIPRTRPYEWRPVPVAGVSEARAVACGSDHACAVVADGGVYCWGDNVGGQLADPDRASFSPRRIAGVTDAVEVAAGYQHTCVRLVDGSIRCWGDNSYGQLGEGTLTARTRPVKVGEISDAIALAAGGLQTCAIRAGGGVACWGGSGGPKAVGPPPSLGRVLPVAIGGLPPVQQIAVASEHACVVLVGGGVRCWGDNSVYQLGDGTTIASSVPIAPHF